MSSPQQTNNISTTEITKFIRENKMVNLRWEFLNGDPCVVIEYIPSKYLTQENRLEYKFDVWPNDPRYTPLWNLNYKKPDFIKEAYEFLKNKVYVGYLEEEKYEIEENSDDEVFLDEFGQLSKKADLDSRYTRKLKTIRVNCYVEKEDLYKRDLRNWLIKIYPNSKEYEFYYIHPVNRNQIHFQGRLNH